ncbi:MAG TPA: serine hydrolase [bacterium]|nr:serine hydrolase [bacterium]
MKTLASFLFFVAILPVWAAPDPITTPVLVNGTPDVNSQTAATTTPSPSVSPETTSLPNRSVEGYWYEAVNTQGLVGRFSLLLEKNGEGITEAFLDDIDNGKYHQRLGRAAIKEGQMNIKAPSGNFELNLSPDGNVLAGKEKIGKRAIKLHFKRGMNFAAPRVDIDGNAVTEYTYQIPQTLDDGWPVGDLLKSDMDVPLVEKGVGEILNGHFPHFQGLVVVHNDRLLVDEYFQGFGPENLHELRSDSKSVLSLLFGIAQDRGLVGLDQKLYDFYPEYRDKAGWAENKNYITLRYLLTMSSGFDCADLVPPFYSCLHEMIGSRDWLESVLSQPLSHQPGAYFAYCSSCLIPLGDILRKTSNLSVPAFAQKYLFDPLQITHGYWLKGPHGVVEAEGADQLRPRDMAKLGYLCLKKGKWNGQQIVSEEWVSESTAVQTPKTKKNARWGYGYLWWIREISFHHRKIKLIYADGRGGQYIFIVPDLNLVCVTTAGNYLDKDRALAKLSFDFFETYILGAVK